MAYDGGLTTKKLIEEIEKNLGDRTDVTDTQKLRWLNLSQVRLARMHNFQEMYKTVSVTIDPLTSSTTDYKVYNQKPGSASGITGHEAEAITYEGGGLRAMESVRVSFGAAVPYDRSYMLSYMGRRQFHRLIPTANSSLARQGYPSAFTAENEQLYLYKIPNKKYFLEIGYWSWPLDMATPTASTYSAFDGKDDILICFASSMGFHQLGMRESGIQYYAMASALLQDAIDSDGDKPSHVITGRGTSSTSGNLMGEPWNDPFVAGIGN